MPPAIQVTARYDKALQEITGRAEDPVVLNIGAPFIQLLQNILMAYPEIQELYPPGTLAIIVNGSRPEVMTLLQDGDIVDFSVPHKLQ